MSGTRIQNLLSYVKFKKTALLDAASTGNLTILKRLLNNASEQLLENYGDALHAAIIGHHEEVVDLLLEHEADVNHQDSDKYYPLHRAVKLGLTEIARSLLEFGAQVNAPGPLGQTPIMFAVKSNNRTMVELLLEEKVNLEWPCEQCYTALHMAVFRGNLDLAELLLEQGATPNTLNREDETPLMTAIRQGSSNMVELLLDHGADMNQAGELGDALHQTVLWGQLRILRQILRRQVPVDKRSPQGYTALHLAVRGSEDVDFVRVLLEHGSPVDTVCNLGTTPLITAVTNENHEKISLLLEYKANVNMPGSWGTPLHYAVKHRQIDITAMLLDRGADINADSRDGTPLHVAAKSHHLPMLVLLLDSAADINVARAKDGLTPVQIAVHERWDKIIDLFMLHMYKLKENNVTLHPRNLSALHVRDAHVYPDIQRMKKEIVAEGYDVNMYDVFTEKISRLMVYFRNEDIKKKIIAFDTEKKCLEKYKDLLQSRIKHCQKMLQT